MYLKRETPEYRQNLKIYRIFDLRSFFFLFSLFSFLSLFSCTHTTNTRQEADNVNGFFADTGSFKIINYEGKKNVIRVNGANTQWAVLMYSLSEYTGKEITIQISANVKRTGAAGNLNWQVNDAPYYPSASFIENAAQGVWHNMRGRLIVTPANECIRNSQNPWYDRLGPDYVEISFRAARAPEAFLSAAPLPYTAKP